MKLKIKSLGDIESVGWIFFSVLFVLLLYPGYLLARAMTIEGHRVITVGLGLTMAAVAASLVAWGVNEVLQRRHMRKLKAQQKAEKRQKRNKKKKGKKK